MDVNGSNENLAMTDKRSATRLCHGNGNERTGA